MHSCLFGKVQLTPAALLTQQPNPFPEHSADFPCHPYYRGDTLENQSILSCGRGGFYFASASSRCADEVRVVRLRKLTSQLEGSAMRRTICIWLLLVGLALQPVSVHPGTHSAYHSRSEYSYHSRSGSSFRPVRVRPYTRKDGIYLSSHSKGLPGTSHLQRRTHSSRQIAPRAYFPGTHSRRSYRNRSYLGDKYSATRVARDKRGRIKRSVAAKDEFKRRHPCPSTGKGSGLCPGYVIDHVKPLECGGPDSPSNMQWQTLSEGKAKDKTERYCR